MSDIATVLLAVGGFVAGVVIGILGTLARFGATVAVLQTQVTALVAAAATIGGQVSGLERDVTNLGNALRAELRARLEQPKGEQQ